jgi:AraC-like DNA-binding protein
MQACCFVSSEKPATCLITAKNRFECHTMMKSAREFYRYPAVDPRHRAWGLNVTGVGYQPVLAGDDPIPKRRHPRGHFYTWDAGRVLSEYAVVYVAHGHGEFHSHATGAVPLAQGDAAILFPGVWHRYRPDRRTGWAIYWVHFLGDLPVRFQDDRIFLPERAVIRGGIDAAVVDAFRSLLDGLRADSAGCGPIAAAKTLEILARLGAGAPTTIAGPRLQEIVREARLLLEADPGGLPVIDDLIRRFDVSRAHFFRAFKQQTGHTPYQYHLQLAMRRAGEMLRNSPLSVKEIAYALGFSSPYHFSKLFKSKTGAAPSDYRRQWCGAAAPARN